MITLAPRAGVDDGSAGDLLDFCFIQERRLCCHIDAESLGSLCTLPRPEVRDGVWALGSSCADSDTYESDGLARAASESARSPMAINFAARVLPHGLSPAWSEVSTLELNDANKSVSLSCRVSLRRDGEVSRRTSSSKFLCCKSVA